MINKNVFINCPFDEEYKPLLQTMLFCITKLDFCPKLTSLQVGVNTARHQSLENLIKESEYSIHDISRYKSKNKHEYYRLNMPFELGVDYGYHLTTENHKMLVLSSDEHNWKVALSDFSAFDVKFHGDSSSKLTEIIYAFLIEDSRGKPYRANEKFTNDLKEKLMQEGDEYPEGSINNMKDKDYLLYVEEWLKDSEYMTDE